LNAERPSVWTAGDLLVKHRPVVEEHVELQWPVQFVHNLAGDMQRRHATRERGPNSRTRNIRFAPDFERHCAPKAAWTSSSAHHALIATKGGSRCDGRRIDLHDEFVSFD